MDRVYSRVAMQVVVAQVCKELGFQSIQESACEALAEITQKYIEEIGITSHKYAESTSRTESNFNDIRQALKDLHVSLDDLRTFALVADDLPFAKDIPEFPLKRPQTDSADNNVLPSVQETEEKQSQPHIPDFLPPFPSPHAYIHTPVFEERITDAKLLRKAKNKEKRQIETSLAKLNEKMGTQPITNYDSARKSKISSANPYMSQTVIVTEGKDSNTKSNFVKSLVAPTPIQRDSSYMATVLVNTTVPVEEQEEPKRLYTEVEESDRAKKRSRAEQILSLSSNDSIDVEIQPKGTVPSNISTVITPIVEKL